MGHNKPVHEPKREEVTSGRSAGAGVRKVRRVSSTSASPREVQPTLLAIATQGKKTKGRRGKRRVKRGTSPLNVGTGQSVRLPGALLETDIQCGFIEALEFYSARIPQLALFFSIPNGAYKSIRQRVKFKREGLKSGVPDLFLPVARAGFHGLFIEFKRPGGKVSPAQHAWHRSLVEQGFAVEICYSVAEALALTWQYLGTSPHDVGTGQPDRPVGGGGGGTFAALGWTE